MNAADSGNAARRRRLEQLNAWRNAIVHQNFVLKPHHEALVKGTNSDHVSHVRLWRTACDELVEQFNRVLRADVTRVVAGPPWKWIHVEVPVEWLADPPATGVALAAAPARLVPGPTPIRQVLPAWLVHSYDDMNDAMRTRPLPRTRRVTANLPVDLLDRARRVTGKGITETLVEGLELVRRASAASKARALRGKLQIEVDLEASRERARH